MDKNILLLAFRSSQINFFKNLKNDNKNVNFEIKSVKSAFNISLNSLSQLNKVDLSNAVEFAYKEFYAKTNYNFIPIFIVKYFFIILSYFNYIRYFKLLNDDSYDKVLIWNGGKFRQRIAIEILTLFNKKIFYYENGLMPNKIVLDKKGINYNNCVPRNKDFFLNYSNNLDLPTKLIPRISKHKSKFNVSKDTLPKKYIFVPFQVDYDTQIISQSPWIHNMRMLFNTIEKLAKNTNINFILKEHPSSGITYNDLHYKVQKYDNIRFENGYDTQELIENSIAVITINSTVGIESLLFSKKVIVLGNAFYGIDDISYKVNNLNELNNIVTNIENIKFNKSLVKNFLKYLYYEYLIQKDDNMYKNFAKYLVNN